MEVYSPDPSRLLLMDNVLTMFLPEEGIRQKTVLPRDEGLSRWFRLVDKPLTRLPDGVGVRAERRDGYLTIRITPKEKKGVKEILVTLLEDGRPKRLVIEEQNQDRTVLSFRRVRKNVGLTADDFRID
jgi:outer membrane lipoprotein carrier protein